ncbi:MAG TPA: FAD-dependent oxidoreductase [Clostridiales bacterium]|nr:FAD-dependent oxidoreductase [Clostridiales bacterium]
MGKVVFQRDLEVRHEVDVLVVGGGPAGVAAAVSAARQGAKVFLAEATACLGGLGTSGMVPAFMQFTDGVNFLAGGIGEEILNKMWEYGGKIEGSEYSIKVEALKRVYDDIVTEAGVDFTLHTQMVAVDAEDGLVNYVVFAAKSGMFAVKAKIYIDGTGDGDLCAWAGAEYEKGDENGEMMAGTLCSLWANIDWDRVVRPDNRRLEEAIKDKIFTYEDRHLSGIWRTGKTLGGGNIGHTYDVDGTDERSLTKSLIWGRKSMTEFERYYREYLDGYEEMELAATGAILGIRESRRIMGDYVMVLDDFINRASFDDEIGRYAYPIDIHPSDTSVEGFKKFEKEYYNLRYKDGESYGIPYRALTPRGLQNVLVAGRCVSCDRYMQSSIRVMPGCYITGQAAGVAAAMAAEKNTDTRGIDIKELQSRLKAIGAYLPNF